MGWGAGASSERLLDRDGYRGQTIFGNKNCAVSRQRSVMLHRIVPLATGGFLENRLPLVVLASDRLPIDGG